VLLDGAVGHELLVRPAGGRPFAVEHPSGSLEVEVDVEPGSPPRVRRSAVIRTARPLFDGTAYPRP
jgi:4-oxalomesaconate tautomerase